ncbi:hypothetical protein [Verrucosispora sp. WMMD573]|uniref:hypothetical protein n=1 Tax=Verrucosispora sp. WMMD573 TaxID=3015149 RepID=UPI00248AD4D7|nr:hypothetical protein [Verrucosispora sp. WMMD573]WBB56634.1 hypothetical protein O7601_11520 [Verrucosispora sp. WMMD573]
MDEFDTEITPPDYAFAGTAHRRAQAGQPHGTDHLAAHSTGLLFGWTSVASVVNVFAARRRGRFAPSASRARAGERPAS